MYQINITVVDNPMLIVGLGLLAITSAIRIVRWVLDILP